MTERTIRSPEQLAQWKLLLDGRKLPITVTCVSGKPRTPPQNRLQRKWCAEAAEQLGDRTAENVRGETKLHIGVPILRQDDEAYAEMYDRDIRPLPYETKLKLMQVPYDLAVTRDMTAAQKVLYLDRMYQYWTEQGVVLTIPDPRHREPR